MTQSNNPIIHYNYQYQPQLNGIDIFLHLAYAPIGVTLEDIILDTFDEYGITPTEIGSVWLDLDDATNTPDAELHNVLQDITQDKGIQFKHNTTLNIPPHNYIQKLYIAVDVIREINAGQLDTDVYVTMAVPNANKNVNPYVEVDEVSMRLQKALYQNQHVDIDVVDEYNMQIPYTPSLLNDDMINEPYILSLLNQTPFYQFEFGKKP